MEVIYNIDNYIPKKRAILTIGTFDGVHVGHQKIISDLGAKSKKEDLCPLVLTFFPHPRNVVGSEKIKSISTLDEKIEIRAPLP